MIVYWMNHGLLGAAQGLRFFPERASTNAYKVDLVYFALLGLALFFIVLIGALALGFGVKYRAGTTAYRKDSIRGRTLPIELTWIIVPTVMLLFVFIWAGQVYVEASTPPMDARTVYVVGKQWMWKVQHQNGRREINELHVPTGEPIKLVMTSQDVIHSFFVPAFRVKRDVLPNRYSTIWFEADKPGTYHLFCAEYCGSEHARMRGSVVVMPPARFQQWLAQEGEVPSVTAAGSRNEPAFLRFGCDECHTGGDEQTGARLTGLFGATVQLADGNTVTADESYIRESILQPNAKIVAGYTQPSLMPSFQGQVSETEMIELIEYIKSLDDGSAESEVSP